MEIHKDIVIVDLALYLKKFRTLVLADTHLGIEESMNKQGFLIPRLYYAELMKRLEKIFDEIATRTLLPLENIIINGDVKHEFGKISETEWRYVVKLLDYLHKKTKNIIFIQGNHDTILKPIAQKKGIAMKKHMKLGSIMITHGDFIHLEELKESSVIIIGHEHPAITIGDTIRRETYKCFLKGTYKGKTLIVQPSFNLVHIGTDILKEKLLSPFLQGNLQSFEVYVIEDTPYYFGKLKDHSIKA